MNLSVGCTHVFLYYLTEWRPRFDVMDVKMIYKDKELFFLSEFINQPRHKSYRKGFTAEVVINHTQILNLEAKNYFHRTLTTGYLLLG